MSDDEEQYSGEEEVEEEEVDEEENAPSKVVAEAAPEDASSEVDAASEVASEIAPEAAPDHSVSDVNEMLEATKAVEDTTPKLRRVDRTALKEQQQDDDADTMTEAEKAMMAAKKRHEEEQAAKIQDYEERRKQELHQVEQDLEVLKVRQIERKKQREIEEQEFAERRRQEDVRRRQEEEERKNRIDAQKRTKEEEKLKRQQMMAGGFITTSVGNKKKSRTAEQYAEAKRNYLTTVGNKPDTSSLLPNDLKAKIKTLYQRIMKLEADKYDLEKRHDRQDYDLKELNERQSQHARNTALARGVEVEEADGQTLPPKINISSKFDRRTDHRSYGDRREQFENPLQKADPSIAHGSGRPPTDWGRKQLEELENLRKNMEPFRYVEQVKAEGDAAKPPVDVIPLQIPTE